MTEDASAAANRFQEKFGLPSERARCKIHDHLSPWALEFVKASPFLVMASADGEGCCDASPRGGEAGFVAVLDERTLAIPDVRGNRLFQSLQNIESNPHVGLIFMIPGLEETLRVNGRAAVEQADGAAQAKVQNPDATARRLQTIRVDVEEAYVHCPRALVFGDLWNSETLARHRAQRPIPRYRF